MQDWEAGFIAGILEGEGYLTIHQHFAMQRRRNGPARRYRQIEARLTITNTSKPLLQTCQRLIGGHTYSHRPWKNPRWNQAYEMIVGERSQILAILCEVYPYLVAKREIAGIMKNFLRHRLKKQPTRAGWLAGRYDAYDLKCYRRVRALRMT